MATANETGIDPVTLSAVWRRLLTITSEIGYRVMHSAQSYVMGMVQDLSRNSSVRKERS
jgi:hypothetical protein